MTSDATIPSDLPDSLAEVLDQHDVETLLAVHEYSEELLEERGLEEEIEGRSFG